MARSLLRSKDVRLITLAVGLSAMGDWLALAPLGLHLADSTGSGFALAALMASLWRPRSCSPAQRAGSSIGLRRAPS